MKDAEKLYWDCWKALRGCLEDRPDSIFDNNGPFAKRGWIRLIKTSKGKVFFSAVASVKKREIAADFTIEKPNESRKIFESLKLNKDNIEDRFGGSLIWEPCTDIKYRIYIRRSDVDIEDKSQWREQHDWLIKHIGKLFHAIKPYAQFLEK